MSDFLNPEPESVLEEVFTRHGDALSFMAIAVELGFQAVRRASARDRSICPGIPHLRRHFNDVNDNVWRFARHMCSPLVEEGKVREFRELEGGSVVVMPDGLPIRIKKGDESGRTSNYQTNRLKQLRSKSTRMLFNGAHDLDLYIADGQLVDLVYCVGDVKDEYQRIGLRFTNAKITPFHVIDFPADDVLSRISGDAFRRVSEWRTRLAG